MILEARNLFKSFGSLSALSDVSFAVEAGETYGIAGPNGAGKSTLFNVITGLYAPTSGKVHFEGEDITDFPPHRVCYRGIGRTFQIPTTFHSLNVHENLKAGMLFGRGSKDRLEQVIEYLELEKKLGLSTVNLDLYTTKLVMLGTVLSTSCRLLLLDEPMAGLSLTEISSFVQLIQRVQKAWGMTVLIIEHLLDVLLRMVGCLMILDNGKVIAVGEPSRVIADEQVVRSYLGVHGGQEHAERK